LSVLDFTHFGSSLSLRTFARLGSAVSLLDSCHMGASLSLRTFSRVGQSLSVYDLIHTHDVISDGPAMYHYASGGFLGASRATVGDLFASMTEVHGSLLATGGVVVGSVLGTEAKLDGARGDFRLQFKPKRPSRQDSYDTVTLLHREKELFRYHSGGGSLSGSWTMESPLRVLPQTNNASITLEAPDSANISMNNVAGTFTLERNGTKVLSASSAGATLHGLWVSDNMLQVSDRRLKRSIRSLSEKAEGVGTKPGTHAPSWLLRQLRPVSYHFRRAGLKGKSQAAPSAERYGFIADEVQKVVPSVVYPVAYHGDADIKAVAYQDLIALLVAAQQGLQQGLQEAQEAQEENTVQTQALNARLDRIEHSVQELVRSFEKVLRSVGLQQVGD